MAKLNANTRFRPGPSGACESRLWNFIAAQELESAEPPLSQLVAASSLEEAVHFMQTVHPDFDIREVKMLGLIEVVSGSPLG